MNALLFYFFKTCHKLLPSTILENRMKQKWTILLIVILICSGIKNVNVQAAEIEVSSPSAILMEASTGQVLYEKDADTRRAPASVTKIMTMLLIFDAIEAGKIALTDTVTVSEFAASMGGSQVFLEPGETQTVDTMLKCISIASANDACVAMAEHIYGTEEAFVAEMNARAQGLGMTNTTFINCNGLDAEGHLTTAKDIALMSRELITKYPQVQNYCMVWMENITHTTKKGSTEFGLTNTNKLVRHYSYATGLKTGSTSEAMFCMSATAKKDDIELIAVIMGAETSKIRFNEATKLLNYGFTKCTKYKDETPLPETYVNVNGGEKEEVKVEPMAEFTYVDVQGNNLTQIEREIILPESVNAPIKKGQQIGKLVYSIEEKNLGEMSLVATDNVEEMKMKHAILQTLKTFLL